MVEEREEVVVEPPLRRPWETEEEAEVLGEEGSEGWEARLPREEALEEGLALRDRNYWGWA